jgi:hypothetical protein
VIAASEFVATGAVFTVKVAVLEPAETVTLAGTLTPTKFDDKCTTVPPAGAFAERVTVPVVELPPITVAGDKET